MKYLRKFYENTYKTSEAIEYFCYRYMIDNYSINSDGSIDVDDVVDIRVERYIDQNHKREKLKEIPIKFNRVSGSFICSENLLENLNNSPKYVGDDFICDHNLLVNLIGSPEFIGGGFSCRFNKLNSLKGCTREIGMDFNCCNNELISLVGGPERIGDRLICYNNKLTNLIGAPKYFGGGDIINEIDLSQNDLPDEIYDNIDFIREIIEKQDDYQIWNSDGSFNKGRFKQLMIEIEDEKN